MCGSYICVCCLGKYGTYNVYECNRPVGKACILVSEF